MTQITAGSRYLDPTFDDVRLLPILDIVGIILPLAAGALGIARNVQKTETDDAWPIGVFFGAGLAFFIPEIVFWGLNHALDDLL